MKTIFIYLFWHTFFQKYFNLKISRYFKFLKTKTRTNKKIHFLFPFRENTIHLIVYFIFVHTGNTELFQHIFQLFVVACFFFQSQFLFYFYLMSISLITIGAEANTCQPTWSTNISIGE